MPTVSTEGSGLGSSREVVLPVPRPQGAGRIEVKEPQMHAQGTAVPSGQGTARFGSARVDRIAYTVAEVAALLVSCA